ncbi:hypothetical protein [Providencia sp. Me31A]
MIETLRNERLLDMKKSMETVAHYLRNSRASAYLYAKKDN